MTVPGVLLALLVGWYVWPEPDKPTMPVEQAHHQIETELTDLAEAFHPGLQWAEASYYTEPELTGFCGTSGCKKTGRAVMIADQAARVRIASERDHEALDIVRALWSAKGYAVQTEGWSVKVDGSGFTLRFIVDGEGCADVEATISDVTDTSDNNMEGGFAQGPQNYAASCAIFDDPYWSH
ncbi:hypothetical protein E6W39_22000 [Kitasatospora acidiphila]|uniref:Uncharacterized protein n=1 Tax=Kitasatospora acidiphila TaxID=2567942 RepID=A0A540W5W9_9ACTN|nr:hypothetical protein [Kitasatospora acidiphila]TQF04406.1 hypothetical protein E6W39_22000 [Kitasatospora acidiphila]